MKYSKWIGVAGVILIIASCWMEWIIVPSVGVHVGGMIAKGQQNFGKPGLLNLLFSVAAAIFFLTDRIWAKRTNIFVCGINLAWALRNFVLLSRCYAGDCPERQPGLYLLLGAAVLLLLMAFMPDTRLMSEDARH